MPLTHAPFSPPLFLIYKIGWTLILSLLQRKEKSFPFLLQIFHENKSFCSVVFIVARWTILCILSASFIDSDAYLRSPTVRCCWTAIFSLCTHNTVQGATLINTRHISSQRCSLHSQREERELSIQVVEEFRRTVNGNQATYRMHIQENEFIVKRCFDCYMCGFIKESFPLHMAGLLELLVCSLSVLLYSVCVKQREKPKTQQIIKWKIAFSTATFMSRISVFSMLLFEAFPIFTLNLVVVISLISSNVKRCSCFLSFFFSLFILHPSGLRSGALFNWLIGCFLLCSATLRGYQEVNSVRFLIYNKKAGSAHVSTQSMHRDLEEENEQERTLASAQETGFRVHVLVKKCNVCWKMSNRGISSWEERQVESQQCSMLVRDQTSHWEMIVTHK